MNFRLVFTLLLFAVGKRSCEAAAEPRLFELAVQQGKKLNFRVYFN